MKLRLAGMALFGLLVTLMPIVASGANDAKKIKTEQQAAKKVIKENTRKLESNKREIKKQIGALTNLQKEIGAKDYEIEALAGHIANLDSSITDTRRQIDLLTTRLVRLKSEYGRLLRRLQGEKIAGNPLNFLLSARTGRQFMERLRYLRAIKRSCAKKMKEIEAEAHQLGVRKSDLSRMLEEKSASLGMLNSNKAQLQMKQKEMDRSVAQLKREGKDLQNEIAKKKTQLANLDRRLSAIIEADRKAREERTRKQREAKKKNSSKSVGSAKSSGSSKEAAGKGKAEPSKKEPQSLVADEDRALNGDFESNKGRLLFPVSGAYRVVRGFGKTYYGGKVETPHVGVDIQVAKGTKARTVFEGVVTNVSNLDGFNTIVVIRHGSYLTVYVNLTGVQVKAGQKVKAGQVIGTVAPDDEGRNAVLQFGLRKERMELNPLLWVK